jgi:hypothetical protein
MRLGESQKKLVLNQSHRNFLAGRQTIKNDQTQDEHNRVPLVYAACDAVKRERE